MKHILAICIVLFFGSVSCFGQASPANKNTYKVVLDAGHGGNKPGALGKHSKEKDITLQIVLKLGKMIPFYLHNAEVIYTRTKDVDVELYKRAQIANQNHADIFISIHCNSTKNPDVYGHETFAMGLAKSDANLAVAKKENADMLLEKNYQIFYDGFDPNSIESHIMFSLYQNAYMEKSLNLASRIQLQFGKHRTSTNRGVKQAGFMVLFRSAMPAVLIEVGFISNPKEEQYMLSEDGQVEIAGAILRSLCEYQAREKQLKVPLPSMEQIKKDYKNDFSPADKKSIAVDPPAAEPTKPDPVVSQEEQKERQNSLSNQDTVAVNDSDGKPVFRVQLFTSKKELDYSDKRFKNAPDLWFYTHEGFYRYTSGSFATQAECMQHLRKIKDLGFNDAFVVAFLHNERISLSKARKIATHP